MSRRKPPDQRQGRGTNDVGELVAFEGSAPLAPARSDGVALADHLVDAWATFWTSDLAGMVVRTDMSALVRLWRLYDQRDYFEAEFLACPMSKGSTHQDILHPYAKLIATIDARIDKLEAQFGIGPKSRMDLGVQLGAARKSLDDMSKIDHPSTGDVDADPRS